MLLPVHADKPSCGTSLTPAPLPGGEGFLIPDSAPSPEAREFLIRLPLSLARHSASCLHRISNLGWTAGRAGRFLIPPCLPEGEGFLIPRTLLTFHDLLD
jgi:hypothetical protein